VWILTDSSVEDLKVYGNAVIDGTLTQTGNANLAGNLDITGALTFDAGGPAITAILDEDAMGSDSAVSLATQQSIKAYVTTSVAAALGSADLSDITGYFDRPVFTLTDDDTLSIGVGRYHHDGTSEQMCFWDSAIAFDVGSGGSNAGSDDLGASEWHYLYIDDSAVVTLGDNELTASEFINTTTAPTWSDAKHGWYNSNDRCIMAFYSDSSSDIWEFYHDGGDLFSYTNGVTDNSGYPGTSFTAKTLTIPTFCTAAQVTHALRPNGTVNTTYCFWRTTGSTATYGHRVGRARIGNNPQNTNFNSMKTICNSSQQIDIKVDVADANNLYYLYTDGYFFPKGM
jgi:hypothetical protein